jgi:hypothetical protein
MVQHPNQTQTRHTAEPTRHTRAISSAKNTLQIKNDKLGELDGMIAVGSASRSSQLLQSDTTNTPSSPLRAPDQARLRKAKQHNCRAIADRGNGLRGRTIVRLTCDPSGLKAAVESLTSSSGGPAGRKGRREGLLLTIPPAIRWLIRREREVSWV